MRIEAEGTIEPSDAYRLIATTARRSRRGRRLDALLPALPPGAALLAALLVGRLPLEVAVAAAIALGVLLLYVASVDVPPASAAAFLDRVLGAKEHFLTLSTLSGGGSLRRVVEAGAADIARQSPEPSLPPHRRRPLVASVVLSTAGFALLWLVPNLAVPAATGDSLEQIAAELARSPDTVDRRLAGELHEVLKVLGDPGSSTAQRLAKVKAAIDEIEAAKRKAEVSSAGSASGEQGKGEGGGRQGTDGQGKGRGQGQQPGAQGKEQGGGGRGDARDRAREQLSKLAGELSAAMQGQSAQTAQKDQMPKTEGGGIQGPKSSAQERKADTREATSNQPGERPDQQRSGQNQGGEQGEARAQAENRPQNQAEPRASGAGGGSSTDGAAGGPSPASNKPAQRYYGPGEGPDGRIVDGRYVRIRVPQDSHLPQGTEEVAKPGDVVPKVGYGNAPLPQEGSVGKVSTEQPLPLEYRGALGQGAQ